MNKVNAFQFSRPHISCGAQGLSIWDRNPNNPNSNSSMQLSLGTEQFTFVIVSGVVLGSPALLIGVLETQSLGLIVPPRHRTVVLGSYFTCRVSSEVSF